MSLAEQINAAKELVAWWPDDIRISHGLPELGDRHPVRLLQDELIATQNTLDEKDGLVESLSAQVAELQQKSIATRAFDCKELEAQVAELKKDAERMDWIEGYPERAGGARHHAQPDVVLGPVIKVWRTGLGVWLVQIDNSEEFEDFEMIDLSHAKTLRAAIDAAKESGP